MRINKELIDKLNESNITIDEITFMYSLHFGLGWEINLFPASLLKLKRYNFINENHTLTVTGETFLLEMVEVESEEKLVPEVDRFDEIWFTFPLDDAHGVYQKSRQIRYNKSETRRAYLEALKFKTHDELMQALKNEVAYRTQPNKENLLKYMYISYNWFSKKGYENELVPSQVVEDYGKRVI